MAQIRISKDRSKQKHSLSKIQQLRLKLSKSKSKEVQKINTFLQDPASFTAEQPSGKLDFEQPPTVEPWLEELQPSSQTVKQQLKIRREINYILGVSNQGNDGVSVSEIEKADPVKIKKKLKKYQPTNSSFSLLYGEKKGMERIKKSDPQNQAERGNAIKFKLPQIQISGQSTPRYTGRGAKTSRSVKQMNGGNEEQLSFISQIKEIYRAGSILTQFSDQLIHKIDSATAIIDRKYDILNTITVQMSADVGTYHLDEEYDRDYKKNLLEVPSRMLRKH